MTKTTTMMTANTATSPPTMTALLLPPFPGFWTYIYKQYVKIVQDTL